MSKKALCNILYPIVLIAAVLAIWSVAAYRVNSKFLLPTVAQTVSALAKVLSGGGFYSAFFGTVLRTFLSFLISVSLALIFSLLSRQFEPMRRLISPLLGAARALPTMAVVLLIVIWTNSQIAPIVVSQLVILPSLYTHFMGELDGLDSRIGLMAKLYKVPKRRIIFKYYIPQLLPVFVLASGAALSLNIKLMVAAEVLSQTANSLGGMMYISNAYFETARLMALTVITVITGLAFEGLSKLFYPLWRWRR